MRNERHLGYLAIALATLLGCADEGAAPEPAPPRAQAPADGKADQTQAPIPASKLDAVLEEASAALMALRREGEHWNFGYHLGTPQSSLFYMLYVWLEREPTFMDTVEFERVLRAEQYDDGSWGSFLDPNLETGTLDTTIINYMAMKLLGVDVGDEALFGARAYIEAQGGVEEAIYPTQMLLALFDSYPWSEMHSIPDFLIDEDAWVNLDSFAQWIAPNFYPVMYMRELELAKDLGPARGFRELLPSDERDFENPRLVPELDGVENDVIQKLLTTQQRNGSWGGYVGAALLSIVCLDHFGQHHRYLRHDIDAAVENGLYFVEAVSKASPDGNYEGVPSDGRYWDTALTVSALLEAGLPSKEVESSARLLARVQTPRGGSPFGLDFEDMPDLDDTAEAILAMQAVGGFDDAVRRAMSWTFEMQNTDGGWAAFSKDNTVDSASDWVLQHLVGLFAPASFFYDASSADVTGHVLEALAATGLSIENADVVRLGVEYLEDTQIRDRRAGRFMWEGTWGVNYLYGTSAALVGLLRVGVPVDEPYVAAALGWLESCQNADGGFGETTDSYDDESLACVGVSTASQTAWVLTALVEAGRADESAARRAAAYLVAEHGRPEGWTDASITGTGHPGFLYMEYNAYPRVFPLTALARYRHAVATD